jgi:hypothetical protein
MDESASSVTPVVTVGPLDSGPVTASTSAVDPFKSQLISLLGIAAHLVAGSRDVSLPLAYQKFKAFLLACHTFEDMVGKRTWTIQKPTRTDLIELFVSKSFYHSHYKPHFTKVADYPEMVKWLKGGSDLVAVDVWGVQRESYSFSDLSVWMENGGNWKPDSDDEEDKVVKRCKGKGRAKGLDKGKGKEKEKALNKDHKKKQSKKKKK